MISLFISDWCIFIFVAIQCVESFPSFLKTAPTADITGPNYNYGQRLTLQCKVGDRSFERLRFCTYNPINDKYEMQGSSYECGGRLVFTKFIKFHLKLNCNDLWRAWLAVGTVCTERTVIECTKAVPIVPSKEMVWAESSQHFSLNWERWWKIWRIY